MPPAKPRPPARPRPAQKPTFEVVDPVWLLKALGVCVVLALICAYATLCLLFYQGTWQLVLHPTHTVGRTPAQAGLAFSGVHFDSAETGQPRLTGWWIPAVAAEASLPRYSAYTVLYLHDGSGSLSDSVPSLERLHATGLNIFAFDYRGFGASDSTSHPSAESMSQDTTAALDYLTTTRHISAATVVPYGVGLGASLAATLAKDHPELPAVVLDNPDADPPSTAVTQRPSHIVPVRWLFGDQFDIAGPIATLKTPKLLIAGGPNSLPHVEDTARLQALFQKSADPRFSVTLPPGSGESEWNGALVRFLDQDLTHR